MKKILKWIFGQKNWPQPESKNREKQLSDIKVGEWVTMQWNKLDWCPSNVIEMKCLSNDPPNQKILLMVCYSDGSKERYVFSYSAKEFKNFHLLNKVRTWTPSDKHNQQEEKKPIGDYNIVGLQQTMNKALEDQDYELANELQKKIDALVSKK